MAVKASFAQEKLIVLGVGTSKRIMPGELSGRLPNLGDVRKEGRSGDRRALPARQTGPSSRIWWVSKVPWGRAAHFWNYFGEIWVFAKTRSVL